MGSILQADCWWPNNDGFSRMPFKVSKPRRQCLDHFISKQRALKSQGCGKSAVKLCGCCHGYWMMYICICALKHSFSHELLKLEIPHPVAALSALAQISPTSSVRQTYGGPSTFNTTRVAGKTNLISNISLLLFFFAKSIVALTSWQHLSAVLQGERGEGVLLVYADHTVTENPTYF